MRALVMDGNSSPSPDESIYLSEKPNPFLYSLESTRIFFPFLLCVGLVQALVAYAVRPVPIAFLLTLLLLITSALFVVFFFIVVLVAFGIEFAVTNKRVVLLVSRFGAAPRQMSLPIDEIEALEVRCYGPRYGSVYFERFRRTDAIELRQPKKLEVRASQASIWLSLPWGWPPLAGFYGFRNYDEFAKLVVQLRSVEARANLGEFGRN